MIFFYIFLISASFASDEELLITREFTEILKESVTWEVEDYEYNIFKNWDLEETKSMLLTESPNKSLFDKTPSVSDYSSPSLPESYDFRTAYPNCQHIIRNQGKCGSCWAFATVESLGDRFCKNGRGVMLSAQEVVSCCKKAKGCAGGYLDHAFDFFEEEGVVTEKCIPYVSQKGNEPRCEKKCKEGDYIKYKCKLYSSKYFGFNVNKLKIELMNNGPIAGSFLVYKDFYYYKGGVYYHKTGDYLGLHAVEAIGWGVENGMNYWIIANSWGSDWGEKGYFRMKVDDCGINKGMISCTPLL